MPPAFGEVALHVDCARATLKLGGRGPGSWVGELGFIDRTTAERWTNVELFAAPIDDPTALWVHELIGQRVVDQDGIDRGMCTAVLENPAAEIIETDSGALIPANFVVTAADGTISVDVPDGLFELNDD